MKFRQNRGALEESMETVVEVRNPAELIGLIKGIRWEYPGAPPVSDEAVTVKKYAGRAGIGWKEVYVVTQDCPA